MALKLADATTNFVFGVLTSIEGAESEDTVKILQGTAGHCMLVTPLIV